MLEDEIDFDHYQYDIDEVPLPPGVSTSDVDAETVKPGLDADPLSTAAPTVCEAKIVDHDCGRRNCDWFLQIPEHVCRQAGLSVNAMWRSVHCDDPMGPHVKLTVEHPSCGGQAVLHRGFYRDCRVNGIERLVGCWGLKPGERIKAKVERRQPSETKTESSILSRFGFDIP